MKYVVPLQLPPARPFPTSELEAIRYSVALSLLGPPGPRGMSADNSTVFVQANPVSIWTISHGFGRPVDVSVYTPDGQIIEPDVFCDNSTVVLTFSVPTAGKALIS